jgi:hypothetical protein
VVARNVDAIIRAVQAPAKTHESRGRVDFTGLFEDPPEDWDEAGEVADQWLSENLGRDYREAELV